MDSNALVIDLSNNQQASFDWFAPQQNFGTGDPNAHLRVPGKTGYHGIASGGLQGNTLDFVVKWQPDSLDFDKDSPSNRPITAKFHGSVDQDGHARGNAVDDKNFSVDWDADSFFSCADAPAPAEPAAPAGPTKCTGLGIAPPGKTCADLAAEQAKSAPEGNPAPAEPPPTNAVTMSFNRSGLTNVTATFSNTSKVSGQCHYDAQDVNGILPGKTDDFPIGANRNVTRTYPAPPPLTTYHAVVSCTGDFNGQNIEFGHAEQDVTG